MALVPTSSSLVPRGGGNMGGFWNAVNNRLVNSAIEYGKRQGGFQSNANTIGGQVYDAIMYYGKNGVPVTNNKPLALPARSNAGLLTYPQPSVAPQVNWALNNSRTRVYRIKQLGGRGTTPAVAWGPGLYADFAGGGLADPFFLQ